ncbi:hypothetical protein J7L27_06260 [Candidatus Bathyarchaeota archaeon]|nr:hypothetical protein [Candidatus Bathyarchaeota archaeon]
MRVAYRYCNLPVEIEIEGEIRPEGLPAILECLLSRLNKWVEEVGNGDRK